MDSIQFNRMKLAEADASGLYDVARLEKLSATLTGLGGVFERLQSGNSLGIGSSMDEALGRMGSAGEGSLSSWRNTKWAGEKEDGAARDELSEPGAAGAALKTPKPVKTARDAFNEKVSSFLTGVPSAIASGLMAQYGGSEFLPAAIGGYVAGDRGGISGGLAGLGSQYALNQAIGEKGTGPLGQLYHNVSGGNAMARRGLVAGSRLLAPIGASKLVDQLTEED